MADVREAVEDLLADKPELESDLRDILAVDEGGPWEFQDIDLDSGSFGEIVSRGIAERTDNGYRLGDRNAVQRALDGERTDTSPAETEATTVDWDYFQPVINPTVLLSVGGAIAFLVALRVAFAYPAVFRNGDVVLLSNDPYAYRYQVEQLLEGGLTAYDPGSFGSIPESIRSADVLFVVVLWWLVSLFGGTADAAGPVLAWFPVAVAAVTGALVYFFTTRVSGDRRVGIAAVLLLAVTPAHAYRTAIGFVDHHGFDYLWLALTLYALVRLETISGPQLSVSDREFGHRTTWITAGTLGITLAGQIMSWRGAPLFLLPLGVYVALVAISDARAGVSPFQHAPLVAGIGTAGLLTLSLHLLFDWAPVYRAYAPALLLLGVLGVLAIAEGARRRGVSVLTLAAFEGAVSVVVFGLILAVVPAFDTALSHFLAFLLESPGIAETTPLFSGRLGTFVGPFLIFGATLFLALPYMVWVTIRVYRSHAPSWLVLVVYGWSLFAPTVVQIRFGGALAVVLAVFAGLGFVHLASVVDLAHRPALFGDERSVEPGRIITGLDVSGLDSRTLASFAILFLLVGGVGLVQTPVKTNQLTYDADQYRAATLIEQHAGEQGRDYPANYVFSPWGETRMYNYFVNGQAGSYTFAERNYRGFVTSTDPDAAYGRFRHRVGYLVLESGSSGLPLSSLHARLFDRFGSADGDGTGVGHYRALYAGSDGSPKVFSLVPGATIVGRMDANESVTVEMDVEIPGASFVYERQVRSGRTGWYAVTVPYEGRYEIRGESTFVSEADVQRGGFTPAQSSRAHWSFEAGRGEVAFDRVGGNHGWVEGANWTDRGHDGSALRFDGTGAVTVPNSSHLGAETGVTVSAWFKTSPDVDYTSEAQYPGIVSRRERGTYSNTNGYLISLGNGRISGVVGDGTTKGSVRGPRVDDGQWHHVVLTWNGSSVVMYLDGERVGSAPFQGNIGTDEPLRIGTSARVENTFYGTIDQVTVRNSAIDAATVRARYNASVERRQ